MSPNGAFTDYMSIPEVQRVLGIVEQDHVHRLVEAHETHLLRQGDHSAPYLTNGSLAILRGRFAKQIAECVDCYPALMAARRPRITHAEIAALTPDTFDRLMTDHVHTVDDAMSAPEDRQ